MSDTKDFKPGDVAAPQALDGHDAAAEKRDAQARLPGDAHLGSGAKSLDAQDLAPDGAHLAPGDVHDVAVQSHGTRTTRLSEFRRWSALPAEPPPTRVRDALRPRRRMAGEGEGMAAFWEGVRVVHGFASRVGFQDAMRFLIGEGKLFAAYLLALQHDREVREQEEAEASSGGRRPGVTSWEKAERAPDIKPSFDPRWTTTTHLPKPAPVQDWRADA